MWPTLLTLGSFHVTIFGIVAFFTFVWADFQIWRKMRLDYDDESIIGLSLFLPLSVVIAGMAGYRLLYHQWGMWDGVGLWAGIWALRVWCKARGWDFWEWADQMGRTWLAASVALNLGFGPARLSVAAAMALGVMVVSWMGAHYRSFKWYPSGKLGFVGLVSLIWWSLSEIVIAMVSADGIYWGGLTAEQWIAAWTLSAAIIHLYLRSGRKFKSLWPQQKRRRA